MSMQTKLYEDKLSPTVHFLISQSHVENIKFFREKELDLALNDVDALEEQTSAECLLFSKPIGDNASMAIRE